MGEYANGRMSEWANERMGEWANGRMGEYANGRMGELANWQIGEWANMISSSPLLPCSSAPLRVSPLLPCTSAPLQVSPLHPNSPAPSQVSPLLPRSPAPLLLLRTLFFVFLISLLIRGLTAWPQDAPRNMDEAYHTVNAMTLARGEGFVEHFIWNYLDPPAATSHPGNLYWLPLSSLIAWPGMVLGGISYGAGQWGFIFLSALLPVLGYVMAWQVSGQVRYARVVALLLLFSGFYFPVWTVIDSFTPFALAASFCLYATWLMLETKQYGYAILAGLGAGLSHLARADGLLLLITVALVVGCFLFDSRFKAKKGQLLLLFGLVLIGYLGVMLPWFIRNMQVSDSVLSVGGSKTMWLQSYADIFSYEANLSWRSYLAWGWSSILYSKVWAIWINLQTLLAVQGLIVVFPLAIVGWWQQRGHLLFQITFLYLALLFVALSLVFTFPGPRGAMFHSGGAILPVVFIAAMFGLDKILEAVGQKRRVWQPRTTKPLFSGALVFFAICISFFVYVPRVSEGGSQIPSAYPDLATYLAGKQATVMVGNPPAYLYYGGYKAIMIPTESIETTLAVAERYGATYLALDSNFAQHPLGGFLSGEASHPRLILEKQFEGGLYLYRVAREE